MKNTPPIIIGTMRLGSWGANLSIKELVVFINQCIELGCTHFDLADIYGDYLGEGRFGKVLQGNPTLRSTIHLTTKCGIKLVSSGRPGHKIKSYDASRKHILDSVEHSLRELNTSYLDELLIHRPDYLLNPKEVADIFSELQQSGKVRRFGVSNFTPSQFDLLHGYFPLNSHQIEASILHLNPFQDGTLDQCIKHNVTPVVWSPFGGGSLFNNPNDGQVKRIRTVALPFQEKYNLAFDQLLLAWLFKHPSGIIPVMGTTKIERIRQALSATNTNISHEDWYALWQASTGEEVA